MIADYYRKYTDFEIEEVKKEMFFNDLLNVSNIDTRLLIGEDIKEYQSLISFFISHVNRGWFDEEFFSELESNTRKLKTSISRFSWSIKALTFLNKESLLENSEDSPFVELQQKSINYLKWLINDLSHYVPDYVIDYKLSDEELQQGAPEKVDGRRNQKNEPSNMERVIALIEFCPDLKDKLSNSSKKVKKRVINMITGASEDAGYRKFLELENSGSKSNMRFVKGLEELKRMLDV